MLKGIRRRRRCVLSVPASSERKIEKALASGVDFVFLDLEDGVAPAAKAQARRNAIEAFNTGNWGTTVRCFRMNGIDSYWALQDLLEVVGEAGRNIDTIVVPKVKQARDVHFCDTLLGLIERQCGIDRPIGLELLIEEVEGIQNIREISAASARIESLMFGVGDYTRAQGVDIRDAMGPARYYPGDIWHFQRSTLAIAARVAGIDYVDGPWGLIADPDGYRNECRKAKTLGAVGKWAIHPTQIPIAMAEFTPTSEELLQALKMKREFEKARAKGLGAIKTADGGMLDEAILPVVNAMLDTARFYGVDVAEIEKRVP